MLMLHSQCVYRHLEVFESAVRRIDEEDEE